MHTHQLAQLTQLARHITHDQLAVLAIVAVALTLAATLYALPWLIARLRHHENKTAIGFLTLTLGWTTVVWLAALVWALTNPTSSRDAQRRAELKRLAHRRKQRGALPAPHAQRAKHNTPTGDPLRGSPNHNTP
jgi:uncharacterized membrane protein